MMDMSLLPPNATQLELDVERQIQTIREIDTPVRAVWNPDECPVALLPWLAWALSVDEWEGDWPEETKRAILKESIVTHRHKGTLSSVRNAVAAFGYGDASIVEGFSAVLYDGSALYDGAVPFGIATSWAQYRVYLNRRITVQQADKLRNILKTVAPARCELAEIIFDVAAHSYNGAITYDGTFSYGAA